MTTRLIGHSRSTPVLRLDPASRAVDARSVNRPKKRSGILLWAVFATGQLGWLHYPPVGSRDVLGGLWYLSVSAIGVAMAVTAVARHRGPSRKVWAAIGLGVLLFLVGDVIWTLDDLVWHIDPFPSIADVSYVAGYPAMAAGLAWLVRGRQPGGDRAALLDAAIIATGVGVIVAVEVMMPALTDSSASLLSRVVSSAYPLGDVLLLAMIARLAVTPGRRLPSFWFLAAGVVVVLGCDAVYNVLVTGGGIGESTWLDMGFMQMYLLVGLAALHGSAPRLVEAVPDKDEGLGRVRLLCLSGAAVLAPGALLLQVLRGEPLYPVLVGFGSIVMFLLVLLRIAGLLRTVQTQSALLAVMARSDALTGLPNRGSWDHELIRLTDDAREHGRPLTVALFDLDHFKRYNDTRGHIAGDRLLRELSSVWRSAVAGRGVLARYGGEEFALAVPGMPLSEVEEIIALLCRLVPDGQCASVGVAARHDDETVPSLMSRVDSALYIAKRSGRNTVSIASAESGADLGSRTGRALTPRMVYQPIVDIVTGRVVALEALARFDASVLPPDEIFARAWLRGQGPELEAAAIAAALRDATTFGDLPVHVNVSARALVTPQVRGVLRANLRSVVIEVTEQDVSADSAEMTTVLDQFRRRGARLAIDDFGVGFSNLRRMIGLHPEIIKLDRSLVMGIEHDHAARSVVAAVAHQAQLTGNIVCAEGVEREGERRTLLELGVPHAQGYLFSRPIPAEEVLNMLASSPVLLPTKADLAESLTA